MCISFAEYDFKIGLHIYFVKYSLRDGLKCIEYDFEMPMSTQLLCGSSLGHNDVKIYIFFIHRLCLGGWLDHGEKMSNFYACNHYEAVKQEGVVRDIGILLDLGFRLPLSHYP